MVECDVRKVLLVTSDCLWYKVRGWRVRGWRGREWRVRGWRGEGYEVVRVGRLPITHTIFAIMRCFSSRGVSLPYPQGVSV